MLCSSSSIGPRVFKKGLEFVSIKILANLYFCLISYVEGKRIWFDLESSEMNELFCGLFTEETTIDDSIIYGRWSWEIFMIEDAFHGSLYMNQRNKPQN